MSAAGAAPVAEPVQVFLEPDDEIRGQKFACLSFLRPQAALMKTKDAYMVSKFLDFFALDYKVRATESFVFGQLRELQSTLSDVELALENLRSDAAAVVDASGAEANALKIAEQAKSVQALREKLARTSAADMEAHVKANMSDFRESAINEQWERYMLTNRQKLEDEFHKASGFRSTLHGLKIRGVYPTQEQAAARAKALNKKDPAFDIYVAEVGAWLPWDFDSSEIEDQDYGNDQLNKLMQAYRENAAKRDAFFEEEKRQKLAEAAAAAKGKAGASGSKPAVFGVAGAEAPAAELGREIFDSADADLAIARKAAATKEAAGVAQAQAEVVHHM
jgi:hypothetical protein